MNIIFIVHSIQIESYLFTLSQIMHRLVLIHIKCQFIPKTSCLRPNILKTCQILYEICLLTYFEYVLLFIAFLMIVLFSGEC